MKRLFEKSVSELVQYHLGTESKELNHYEEPSALFEKFPLEVRQQGATAEEMSQTIQEYLKYSVNTSHPAYANQLWSKVESMSVLGELLASVTNTSMYTYEVAPVATLMEKEMMSYLSELIWSSEGGGVMTSGGTASNLQALLTARQIKVPQSKSQGVHGENLVVLAADNAHYSIKRAVNLLGLGHDNLVEVKTNDLGQMTAQAVETAVASVRHAGKNPYCLVSTAGTTVHGAFDDLSALGELCAKEKLWFHVDGAYGASVLLSNKHRALMKGVQLADSLSWDFHKMLGLNLPCAFLFTKVKGQLRKALSTGNDDYLFHDEDSIDLGVSSLQCGRRNDILKLWLCWMEQGHEGFANRVERLFDLSQELAELVKNTPDFELLLTPESINVCFRFQTENTNERLESEIRSRLLKQRQWMVNFSQDERGPFFRFAVTNPELTADHFKDLLQQIKGVAHELCS